MEKKNVIGGCSKHSSQPFLNCPLCAIEEQTKKKKVYASNKEEIDALLKELNDEQLKEVLYYMAMLIAKRKQVDPQKLITLLNNWSVVEKLIYILK